MSIAVARSAWLPVAIAVGAVAAALAILATLWGQLGDVEISTGGWVAMALGALVTLALGIGLMALVFISSRRGYDEPGGKH